MPECPQADAMKVWVAHLETCSLCRTVWHGFGGRYCPRGESLRSKFYGSKCHCPALMEDE